MISRLPLLLFILASLFFHGMASGETCPTQLKFSGHTWTVSHGWTIAPAIKGFKWDSCNAWVDGQGRLHLKMSKTANGWRGAELSTDTLHGFGTYYVQVASRLDTMPPSGVLGLFPYAGPSGQNEIDVEFSRWGVPDGHNMSYTVYPAKRLTPCCNSRSALKIVKLRGASTHAFTWSSSSVSYRSVVGLKTPAAPGQAFMNWKYAPATPKTLIPQKRMPFFINLWAHNSARMAGVSEYEVIIAKVLISTRLP